MIGIRRFIKPLRLLWFYFLAQECLGQGSPSGMVLICFEERVSPHKLELLQRLRTVRILVECSYSRDRGNHFPNVPIQVGNQLLKFI